MPGPYPIDDPARLAAVAPVIRLAQHRRSAMDRLAGLTLAPGATLLFSTDGLVERPGADLDETIGAVGARAACDPVDALLSDGDTDDTAVLAVRVPGLQEPT